VGSFGCVESSVENPRIMLHTCWGVTVADFLHELRLPQRVCNVMCGSFLAGWYFVALGWNFWRFCLVGWGLCDDATVLGKRCLLCWIKAG
jgi:hypothetical protein